MGEGFVVGGIDRECKLRPDRFSVSRAELKEPAIIVALDGDSVWVETQRQGTCNACSANRGCGQGLMNRLLPGRAHYVRALCTPDLPQALAIGDRVEISVPQNLLLKSSALVYLLPLILLLAGTLSGSQVWPGDPGAILGGALGLSLGFGLVRLHAYRQRDNATLQPRVQWPEGQAPQLVAPEAVILPINELSRVKKMNVMVKPALLSRQVWMLLLLMIGSALPIAEARPLPDFTQIVEEHSATVVKISAVKRAKSGGGASPYDLYGIPPNQIPEIFRHFFERPERPRREASSLGSGFIISTDGYVLTNNHVIDGADEVQVRLLDRREFQAKVVGADRRSDIALLKIEARNLPSVSFAAPNQLKVGEWVLAIGSPFGLDYSVSAGIVSAIGRSIPNQRNENYVPFIQTDVAINPGNSGGPLFNMQGQVVGVNSQIYTRSGGSIGLSFSIPVALVLDVTEQLKADGRVSRGAPWGRYPGCRQESGAVLRARQADGRLDIPCRSGESGCRCRSASG